MKEKLNSACIVFTHLPERDKSILIDNVKKGATVVVHSNGFTNTLPSDAKLLPYGVYQTDLVTLRPYKDSAELLEQGKVYARYKTWDKDSFSSICMSVDMVTLFNSGDKQRIVLGRSHEVLEWADGTPFGIST